MQNIEHGDPHVADQTTTSNQDHRAGDLNTKKNKKQKKEISSDSVSETEVPGDEQMNGTGHVDDREGGEKDTDEVTGDTICTEVNTAQSKKKRRKKKKQKQDVLSTVDFTETQIDSEMKSKNNNRKRKLDAEPNEIKKKKNTADRKISHKGKNNTSSDPLSKLSDERLKAYGLNPKKYRSFLKYKKF
ncbi:hypothetical protein KGM_210523 [Danaus plexippus plexippus]|uniref:Uncharacterized protein n=1 Tax=Danaus plexippus plexippus TaxID=278856 RepID=A0A212F2G5_DANPL|nr:hypothetical protein KGM_210523 [Danaus plexippus plexippus]